MPIKYVTNEKVSINSVSELDVEDAINLKNQGVKYIIILAINHPQEDEINEVNKFRGGIYPEHDYDINTYINVREALNELVEGININASELEKFSTIYKRIAHHIDYDYSAVYPKTESEREYSKSNWNDCRCLTNGLLEGKCVCAGYADILRSALQLVGIEARYVSGPIIHDNIATKEFLEKYDKMSDDSIYKKLYKKKAERLRTTSKYHAWCKVKIDGVWYNADVTWDVDNIRMGLLPKHALLTDEQAKKSGKVDNPGPKCDTEYNKEDLNKQFDVKNIRIYKVSNFKRYIRLRYVIKYRKSIRDIKRLLKDTREKMFRQRKLLVGCTTLKAFDSAMSEEYKEYFKSQMGYSIEELKCWGFSIEEINQIMSRSFKDEDGNLIDKKQIVENRLLEMLEQSSGFSIDEMKLKGLSEKEIYCLAKVRTNDDGKNITDFKALVEATIRKKMKRKEKEVGI